MALVVSEGFCVRIARTALVVGSALLAAAIGGARMLLGVHWLTDVAAGWCLGTAWAVAVVLIGDRAQTAMLGPHVSRRRAMLPARGEAGRTRLADAR